MKENPHSPSPRHSRGALAMVLSVVFFPIWFPCWVLAVATAEQCDRTKEWGEKLQAKFRPYSYGGFTLIELSIVLVIIGLVVGGVLVGQSLIKAAEVKAQVSQLEEYDTAANAFYGKYGYLPGDLPAGPAAQFGFVARGTLQGQGDGNGLIENQPACGSACGTPASSGESVTFWEDLSTAKMIEGGFSIASETVVPNGGNFVTPTSTPNLGQFLPLAKLGNGNYITVWSVNGANYYGISAVTGLLDGILATPQTTVAQAYAIDKKMDDGLPQSGRVVDLFNNSGCTSWAGNGMPCVYHSYTTGVTGNSTTCFDNGGNGGTAQQYSIEQNNGSGMNCALSFRLRSGD